MTSQFCERRNSVTQTTTSRSSPRSFPLVPGAAVLAFALVASIWAVTYFGAEARVRRATARAVHLAEKSGEESPVALGLSANRFGKLLAADAELELEGFGSLAAGRAEIVQLYANVRNSLREIAFENPRISTVAMPDGTVQAAVAARYRLAGDDGSQEGDGTAALHWAKGDGGWQIVRALLTPDPSSAAKWSWP